VFNELMNIIWQGDRDF